MSQLTFEERNLVCIYAADTRNEVIQSLQEMRKHLEEDEVELMELTDATIIKLNHMSEEEFGALDLYPDF